MRPNDEVTSHWSLNWHISFWKPWSFMWDAPVWKERSSKLVPNFTNFSPQGRESTPRAHIDFDDVRTPSEFSVIKIPTRPTPVAAPRGRNVWNFKTSFSRGFHLFPPNVGFRMIFSPCCARDLSRAFWLARTQTQRIVRLHHWMLPNRTGILIPFDNTCSSGCNFIFMHKMHVKLKKCLKYS